MKSNIFNLKQYIWICIFSLVFMGKTYALVSIQIKKMELSLVLQTLCNQLKWNAYISPRIQGEVILDIHQASPEKILKDLLWVHHLRMEKLSYLVWIAPEQEIIEHYALNAKMHRALLENQPLLNKRVQLRFANSNLLLEQIQKNNSGWLSARGHLRLDAANNAIEIEDDAEHLKPLIHFFALADIPPQQVRLEARIASIDEDSEHELGIRWHTVEGVADHAPYIISKIPWLSGRSLDIKLAALEKTGRAELLSKPSLMTLNMQTAFIESGEDVPYQESSESGGTTQTFKKAVLGLQVKPHILPNGNIILYLLVNQDRPSHRLVQGVPVISTRRMQTQVLLHDGQTIVLGGIYENQEDIAQEALPVIHRLPLLGALFKTNRAEIHKRELMIFITPHTV